MRRMKSISVMSVLAVILISGCWGGSELDTSEVSDGQLHQLMMAKELHRLDGAFTQEGIRAKSDAEIARISLSGTSISEKGLDDLLESFKPDELLFPVDFVTDKVVEVLLKHKFLHACPELVSSDKSYFSDLNNKPADDTEIEFIDLSPPMVRAANWLPSEGCLEAVCVSLPNLKVIHLRSADYPTIAILRKHNAVHKLFLDDEWFARNANGKAASSVSEIHEIDFRNFAQSDWGIGAEEEAEKILRTCTLVPDAKILSNAPLTDEMINKLCEAGKLHLLREARPREGLERERADTDDQVGALHFADRPYANKIVGDCLPALATLPNLSFLDWGGCTTLDIDQMVEFLESISPAELILKDTLVDDRITPSLLKMDTLKRLNLENTRMSEVGIHALRTSRNWESFLPESPGDAYVVELLEQGKLHMLRGASPVVGALGEQAKNDDEIVALDLGQDGLRLDGDCLAAIGNLKGLKALSLGRSRNINRFKVCDFLEKVNLQQIDLSNSNVDDSIVPAILKMDALHSINLEYTKLSDTGLETLRESRKWQSFLPSSSETNHDQ